MTKEDFCGLIARREDITQATARRILDLITFKIGEEVRINGRFQLAGLGVFKKKLRVARKTKPGFLGGGKEIITPAHFTCTFSPGPDLKKLVNRAVPGAAGSAPAN